MATFRSLLRCLVVGVASPLALAACGESAPEATPIGDPVPNDTAAGQTSGTATGTPTIGSSASTSAASVTGTPTTTTAAAASTTGVGGSGGLPADTTTGSGPMGSTGSVDVGGAGGVTGSADATSTGSPSSSSTGGLAVGGSGGVGTTSGDTGGNAECEFAGNIRYQFNQSGGWPSDVVERLTTAMDGATYYYNCYADISKELTIGYDPGVPTAQGNVDGWITFGEDPTYQVVATAMHEVAHTLGVAYSPWTELIEDGVWTGPAVVEFMTNLPAEQRDPDMYSQRTYITCDSQHFWPYGLNQASEHQSEWSLINNVRIVAAMQLDKQAYLAGEL